MKRKSNGLPVLLVSAFFAVVSSPASAESCYWIEYDGTYEGNFSEDARWQPKKPTASDNVYARYLNKSDSKIILDGASEKAVTKPQGTPVGDSGDQRWVFELVKSAEISGDTFHLGFDWGTTSEVRFNALRIERADLI